MGRQRLNTGDVYIPGSGDTIHDGGNKLLSNFTEFYLAFGDERLDGVAQSSGGEEWIRPHAMGYFQHRSLSRYSAAVASGSMHDIDSTISAGYFPVILPTIGQLNGQARRGERVVLQDSVSSWSQVPVRVSPSAGQAITGANTDGYYILNEDKLEATFIVVSDEPGSERWDVKIESLARKANALVNETQNIPYDGNARINLHLKNNYNIVKVLIYSESRNITLDTITKRTAFELSIMNTINDTLSTKYAVLNTEENDPIIDVTPVIYSNNAGDDVVALDITTEEPQTQQVTVTVKTVGSLTQRL